MARQGGSSPWLEVTKSGQEDFSKDLLRRELRRRSQLGRTSEPLRSHWGSVFLSREHSCLR